MPTLTDFSSQKPVKMLLIGDSGAGKTGALASLAKAGYNIRVLDFDAGIDTLAHQLKGDTEALARVNYKTCTDKLKSVTIGNSTRIVPDGSPTAFSSGLALLDKWDDLGPVYTWTNKDILVVDSLTHMGHAALRRVLALNNRSGEQPYQSDWGDAMRMLEDTLALLYSEAIRCNVIVMSHIVILGGDEKTGIGGKGYPTALGSKLPPKVGTYFNYTLHVVVKGTGNNARRVIRTVPDGNIEVKSPIQGLPAELPLATGLADFFKAAIG
jgi:hypothetical protein